MKKLLILVLVLLLAVPALAQDDQAPEPRQSYFVCNWGLLIVEESAVLEPPFITISAPEDYSAVGTAFTVSGEAAGLFEGNVIVEVSAFGSSDLLFSGATTVQAEAIDATGEWAIEVDLGAMDEATKIYVQAYSTSPADGSTTALDSLRLNANSEFGLPFVEITRPYFGQGVSTSPLLIEGMAGAVFENNIVIEVQDFATKEVLAETFATIETDELGGMGSFSVEVMVDVEPGTEIEVYAYHPPVAEGEEVTVSDVGYAMASPLARTYDRFLTVQRDDPLYGAEDLCGVAEAEFENEQVDLLVINDVQVISTRSMLPLVHVSIEAAGSSICPAPLRTRIVREADTFNIEIYYDLTNPVPCTMDLAPISRRVSLGTLESPDYAITVNGEAFE